MSGTLLPTPCTFPIAYLGGARIGDCYVTGQPSDPPGVRAIAAARSEGRDVPARSVRAGLISTKAATCTLWASVTPTYRFRTASTRLTSICAPIWFAGGSPRRRGRC